MRLVGLTDRNIHCAGYALRYRRIALGCMMSALGAVWLIGAATPASAAESVPAGQCGHVVLHRYDWLVGHGVAVHENTACPQGVVDYVDGTPAGYEWQCVELINRLYLKRGWTTWTWQGNGNQLYANAPTYLHKKPQGSILHVHPGDVLSLDSSTSAYGHAAVVDTVTANADGSYTLQLVNQNTPSVYSYATLANGYITMWGWSGWHVIGVVHAPRQ